MSKDDAIVKYALSRSLSPALIADYKLNFINKRYRKKLSEIAESADSKENGA